MSRSGRLILGAVIAAGAVLGATQITSGSANSTKESVFVGIVPARLLDTREGPNTFTFDGFDSAVGRLDAGTTYELDIAGRAEVPKDALSVTANLVAVNPSANGYLTVYPCGFDKPLASALNYRTGVNIANEFSVPLGEYDDICIYTHAETDIVVDVYGYYIAGSGTEGPQGPAGPQGPIGTGITVKGTLPLGAAGPPVGIVDPEAGDVWIDVNNDAWVRTEGGTWDNVGSIQGPAGADGADGVSPARVVWVADDNTGDFTKLSDALASITDATATKPYLIKIAPGTYTETANVEMKDHVDVEGSGQDITTIECACSAGRYEEASSVISAGKITAEIRHLTINNTGGSNDYSVGVYTRSRVADGSFSMLHVTATAGGSVYNYGVWNYLGSKPTMNNVTATATGGNYATGVFNEDAGPTMNNVTATAAGGTDSYGVHNWGDPDPTMNNVTATATGGTNSYGVYNEETEPTMNNVTATATGGTDDNIGMENKDSSPTIRNSSITGATNSIKNIDNSSAKIANTTLDGDVTGPGFACAAVNDADFDALEANCIFVDI